MDNKWKLLFSNRGLTLIEVLASITILSIIIVTFLSVFTQTARTNQYSETIMDATYVAQTHMENVYNVSTTNTFEYGMKTLKQIGYTQESTSENRFTFSKNSKKYFVVITVEDKGDLTDVKVEVFNDSSLSDIEAQMQTLLTWEEA
ncbi:type IV pilus modification PilV family protein [Pontibacillus yanchengensis]|uniref:Prepilin-type N-terminal cleavage/methylation domain-containing protein n=1 Tax=Pontibacillus yanchengensis Y32 TaxID=1385514 RepID=A0A0A2TAP0_9BACI|nr:type II secretion system protein [Pontibacillus yanchengensis]KGP72634.1 hypothetical protein N782_11250 [Pontibacillus yanchengensis Y32]